MPASPGIIPDMRYLSPAYLPMLVIGVYALKHAGLDADGVREALKTLFWLAVIDLPLIFVVLQVTAGRNLGGQVTFLMYLTYLFLAGTAVLYVAVFAPGGAQAPAPHLRCSCSGPRRHPVFSNSCPMDSRSPEHRTLRPVALAKRASPRLLAYAVPVLMFFPLAWEVIVDFRFATGCWEGYHFWIPVVEYIWYIQYAIFPL
ncbi:hypothetical protein [Methanoculleus sp.]|nr:hypothetical protein [Methanoculleus sp.]